MKEIKREDIERIRGDGDVHNAIANVFDRISRIMIREGEDEIKVKIPAYDGSEVLTVVVTRSATPIQRGKDVGIRRRLKEDL